MLPSISQTITFILTLYILHNIHRIHIDLCVRNFICLSLLLSLRPSALRHASAIRCAQQ